MGIENVTPALKEWFLDAVMPHLEWYEQLVAGLAMRPSVEERVAQALPLPERWGLAHDGELDAVELMDRLSDTVYSRRDELPVKIAGHTFSLRLANVREILAAAAAKEKENGTCVERP